MDPALSPLLQRMAKALDIPKLNVQIYEIDPINGLAAPDGRIFITRGFYNKYKAGDVSGEELASVIAHELGHVALGHARRRMIDFSGQNAVRAALGMVLGRVLPGIGPWIAGLVANLLMARLSRGDEYEADEYAAALMVKSGLGTDAQKTLFLKLEELTGQIGSLPAWLMSHPKTADRIAAIETLEQKWGLG
ncbi:M48 family metallopeptidase [Paracoccaceae bacterium]|nr:M48 family metallopeptidase [Paracoccaceae bacterium]